MDYKKLLLAAIAYAAVSQIVMSLGAVLVDMPYYADPAYAGVWSRTMMPGQGPPPAEFYILSTVAALVMGAIFASVYPVVMDKLKGVKTFRSEEGWMTGMKYGLVVFLLAGLNMLTLPLLFNIPLALGFSWAAQSLASYLIAGALVGKIYGK